MCGLVLDHEECVGDANDVPREELCVACRAADVDDALTENPIERALLYERGLLHKP